MILLITGTIADILTTLGALNKGAREVNPVAKWMQARGVWIAVKLLLVVLIAISGIGWAAWVCGAILWAVAIWNMRGIWVSTKNSRQ